MVSKNGERRKKHRFSEDFLFFITFYFDEVILSNKVLFDKLVCLFLLASLLSSFFSLFFLSHENRACY